MGLTRIRRKFAIKGEHFFAYLGAHGQDEEPSLGQPLHLKPLLKAMETYFAIVTFIVSTNSSLT